MASYDVARRAVAACLAAEPHSAVAVPCDRHFFEAKRTTRHLSAPAPMSPEDGSPQDVQGGIGGVSGACAEFAARPAPGTSPSDSSPPRVSDTQGGGTGHRYGPQGA